jgi:hypothetical protein
LLYPPAAGRFNRDAGATPEEIVQQYPSLDLASTYAVVAHVLQHRPEVDRYLAKRQADAVAVRQENERRFDPSGSGSGCSHAGSLRRRC